MLHSEGQNCEMPVNNSFSPYTDFRRSVFSSSSELYQQNTSFSGLTGSFKNYDCSFQESDTGTSNSDSVYEQLGNDVGVVTNGSRDNESDEVSREGFLPSCRKSVPSTGTVGQEDSMVYPACRKLTMCSTPSGYGTDNQCFGPASDFTKHNYNGGALYPASFHRQNPAYPMFAADTFNMGQMYYHGQMSPAIGHSPPGLMPMGCVQQGPGAAFYPHGSNICVYLCNRDLWSKFYQHTCEMIITKQGR